MKNFALLGAAGYVAPRHMEAIHATGHRLVAALDPHDSVGILDRYFPNASFFTEIEPFERQLDLWRRSGDDRAVDMVSICSPNYLHDSHCGLALRAGADALCEKPLSVDPARLDVLEELEAETGRTVWTVLQLRVHPALIALREKLQQKGGRAKVELSYITRRGAWYHTSWKGAPQKSGGVATNIGIHFFDLLMWFFGTPAHHETHLRQDDKMAGFLELERADVRWFLSIDRDDLPEQTVAEGKPAFRSITIDGEELEFSKVFTDLHTTLYERTMAGNGFRIADARPAIELVHGMRQADVVSGGDKRHPKLTA